MPRHYQPRIGHILAQADAHAARLTALLLRLAGRNHARAQRAACRIQPACHHRRALAQPALQRRLRAYAPYHAVAGHYVGQQTRIYAELSRQCPVPLAPAHVEAVPAVALRHVLCEFAREFVGDVAVGLEYRVGRRIYLRHLALEPDHLGQRIAGHQRIAAYLKHAPLAQRTPVFGTDLLAAGVHPYRSRMKRPALAADRYRRPALTVYAYAQYIARTYRHALDNLARGRTDRLPPVLGRLLGPARPLIRDRKRTRDLAHRIAFHIEQRVLDARRAHVYAQQILHFILPRALSRLPVRRH